MILRFEKSEDLQLTKHFRLREYHCHCKYPECVYTLVCSKLSDGVELLREIIGEPLFISAFRCIRHNAAEGGRPASQHPLGKGCDVKRISKMTVEEMAAVAQTIPQFKSGGIGLYDWGIHIDTRGTPARWDFRSHSKVA